MASEHEDLHDFTHALRTARPDTLKFPRVTFLTPLWHLSSLCYALAYATTDENGGEVYLGPYLKVKAAQDELTRVIEEAMEALRERLV